MTIQKSLATGRVQVLAINGTPTFAVTFELDGPVGDVHRGFTRRLSGHDGAYIRTSRLERGNKVFNWRSWTGLSGGELAGVEKTLNLSIPPGALLENIVFGGIPKFSQLAPGTRIVFPARKDTENNTSQAILVVWEENGPCATVAARLEKLYPQRRTIKTDFIRAAQSKRGVMGFVLSAGLVNVGDVVEVFPPAL